MTKHLNVFEGSDSIKNFLNPGQYDNPDNPKAHQKWTAKQIWKQTRGRIDVLCAGLGTTGTITGTAQQL
jgi:cysteine synthase A